MFLASLREGEGMSYRALRWNKGDRVLSRKETKKH